MPVCPRLYFGVVDVRDVVDLHLRAMSAPEAAGERWIAAAGDAVSLLDVARILRESFGPAARRTPRHELPDWLVRLGAPFSAKLKAVAPQVGLLRVPSAQKARERLQWSPRSNFEAIRASGESLLRLGLINRR